MITPKLFQSNLLRKSREAQKKIVLPEGSQEQILKAADRFISDGLGSIVLLGNRNEIKEKAKKFSIDLDEKYIEIINPKESIYYEDFYKSLYELRKEKGLSLEKAKESMLDVSYFGTMLVYKNLVDGMVSGSIHTTANTIRPALQFIKTLPEIKNISSVFFMLLKNRVLVYGDCAVIPNPGPEELADIAISSANTARNFGIEPRVALLSYSSGNSGSGPEVEKVKKAIEILKAKSPNFLFCGPIQYDAAVDSEVASRKMPDCAISGKINVFIFPDLNSGNITYKVLQRETDSIAIGPILQGLKKPINDLSRGSSIEDIYNTIIITSIQATYL